MAAAIIATMTNLDMLALYQLRRCRAAAQQDWAQRAALHRDAKYAT
jgi:hypothetical protein